MAEQAFVEPDRSIVSLLRACVHGPRRILATFSHPDIRAGWHSEDRVVPADVQLVICGAINKGILNCWTPLQLVVGAMENGRVTSRLLAHIPPRQCYSLLLPSRFARWRECMTAGVVDLLGWQLPANTNR